MLEEFKAGITKIPLISQTYGNEEIIEVMDSLLSGQVTMGKKVEKFEKMFAEYIGVKNAIMVNSGSSANLLVLSALVALGKLKKGDEVITPAVTWATTVFPIANLGLVPVLVDIDVTTFNLSLLSVKEAITKKTKAIMLVHLLGRPCDMGGLQKIAKENNLLLIEDTCEAHGAEISGKKVGSFGDISTFSFYYSHHITTIEGGMVLTDDDELAETVRSMRVFGWIRELKDKEKISKKYPNLDPRFLFLNTGYCFRPTELQGAFGVCQLKKLDKFIEIRRENAKYWYENLKKYRNWIYLYSEDQDTKHVWFGYPILIQRQAPFTRDQLVNFLESKGVETRPIMSGNMAEQPAMKTIDHKTPGPLFNSNYVSNNAFFFGNHQGIGEVQRCAIVDYFDEFMSRY